MLALCPLFRLHKLRGHRPDNELNLITGVSGAGEAPRRQQQVQRQPIAVRGPRVVAGLMVVDQVHLGNHRLAYGWQIARIWEYDRYPRLVALYGFPFKDRIRTISRFDAPTGHPHTVAIG